MALTKYNHDLHNRKWLTGEDECYYFIEATNGSYEESESNQFLFNFKKPIERKDFSDWNFRNKAIRKFARLLSEINGIKDITFTTIPAPTSKPRKSNLFNNRIDETIKLLKEYCPGLSIEYAFDAKKEVQASHQGGSREPEDIRENIEWLGFKNTPSKTIIFIDDVLTTGAHFKVCKEMILKNEPNVETVMGFFLALYKWR